MSGLHVFLIASTFLVAVVTASGVKSSGCANELCMNNGECRITNENTYECLCRSGYSGAICQTMTKTNRALENRTLTITVKTTLYDLYIDGNKKNLTYKSNWTKPDEIVVSPLDRLICVMAIDSTETCAGVIGSVTDDYLVTDDINWKCDYIPDPMWYLLGYDDSLWPPAYIVGPNHNVTWPEACEILTGIPSISPNAYWIWTDTIVDTPYYHHTVYCRGYLPLCDRDSPCLNGGTCYKNNETLCNCLLGFIGEFCETADTKQVTMTAKDELYAAYIDGIPIVLQNGGNWLQTDGLSVSSISRLLAVMAIKLEGTCPGILAFVNDTRGDYLLTNAQWKCSQSALVGWSDLGYDDSTWPIATIIHKNENTNDTNCYSQFVEISSISSNAYWIWTDATVKQDVVVYCRGYLPICDVHPCKNGGTCNKNKADLCTCLSNTTGKYCELVSIDDVPGAQKSDATDGFAPIPPPNPVLSPNLVPSSNPVPPPAPRPAPIQTSDETESQNARSGIRKHEQRVKG